VNRLLIALLLLMLPASGLPAERLAAVRPDAQRALSKTPAFPACGSERRVKGTLVTADFIHRAGQFRRAENGELVDFKLAPYGAIRYRGAEADLRDVPLDTECELCLVPDAQGDFTRVALIECLGKHDPAATEQQRQRFAAFTKFRGLPGWIDRTAGNKLSITLFSGQPERFKQAWLGDFKIGKEVSVVVANDELRTWNPRSDRERSTLVEISDGPADCFGSSGVRLVIAVPNMLEGFRRGRVVRVLGAGWPVKEQFYGESLMGYGFSRQQTAELMELTPKEYPRQFPFRTDYGNAHLPWYRLQPGEPAPRFSEHLVFGALLKVAADGRSGEFRTDRTGERVDFQFTPDAAIKYLNAAALLSDIPLGTRCRFHLYQDEHGEFRLATLVSDEFSYLAANVLTYRIEQLLLAEGQLHVARRIPEVKNYNGDMEQPPDIGRTALRVDRTTRVWKGDTRAELADLAVGDLLLVNVTDDQAGAPARCMDVWIGAEAQQHATAQQAKRRPPTKK